MENVAEILPLSPVQTGMLFECVSGQAPVDTYVAAMTITLSGQIDPARFNAALQTALSAHDACRACFIWEGVSQPVQLIRKTIEIPFTFLDWTGATTPHADLAEFVQHERHTRFDLKAAPLMRAALIRIDAQTHKFIWTAHHLIADGWSTGLLIDDILAHYDGAHAAAPTVSFRDYLNWLKGRDTAPDKAFWTTYLQGVDSATTIPFKLAEPAESAPAHQMTSAPLDADLILAAKAFAKSQRITTVTLLGAIWALILRRYCGGDDVIFGQTNSGRPAQIAGIDRAVGAFINTLPVRLKIDPEQTISAFLADAEADAIARRAFEHTSLSEVLACTDLPRGEQIFDALFVFEDFPQLPPANRSVTLSHIAWSNSSTYPLTLLVLPGAEWRMEAIYDPAKLTEGLIDHILSDFESLLRSVIKAPGETVRDVVRKSLAVEPPAPQAPGGFTSVVQQIVEMASQTPDATALADVERSMSYRELDQASAELAGRLQHSGVGRGDIIPIAVDRSVQVVVAMMAVLRAGACYTPLDLDYPAERLTQTIAACAPKCIISSTAGQQKLPATDIPCLLIDAEISDPARHRPVPLAPDDLAYVIFTSGSTGKPKGVMISHGNLAYSTQARDTTYPAAPGAFMLMSSFAFDSSVVGIYWTLSKGGKLVISPPHGAQDTHALGQRIQAEAITHILCLPSLWQSLLQAVPTQQLASLDTVIVAGEAVSVSVIDAHRSTLPGTRIFNEYGPTEATVWCAASDLGLHQDGATAPIGHAPEGTRLTITDRDGVALPMGITGEIVTSGPGTAQGYLNDPVATQIAFPNRSYKTGDLGYKRSDGQTVFLGRRDDQIKIRGHRVEPSEVEAALITATGIAHVAVIVRHAGSSPQLAAIIAASPDTLDLGALKTTLTAKLPAHMVPSALVTTPELPRLPNGKIDGAALADLVQAQSTQASTAPAATGFTEGQIARIWQDILGLEHVGRTDNFFDLGGDSLKTIAVALKAEDTGLNIAPYELFEYPRLCDLAALLHSRAEALSDTAPNANLAHTNDDGEKPIFFMIHGSLRMYSYLSATLGRNRPLGFLFSHFFGGEIHPSDRIETLTDEAMAHLKSLKPSGPYHLGGYSLGGIIALELAHRLREAGEVVDTLFLLDPSYNVRNPLGADPDAAPERHGPWVENLAGIAGMALARVNKMRPNSDKNQARMDYVASSYRRILTYYRPPVYEGRTIVMTTPAPDTGSAFTAWQEHALPGAVREELPFGHLELQRDADALMAWTSRLSSILNADGDK